MLMKMEKTFPAHLFPTRDENVNFFNLDAFFTWDFRLGSRMYWDGKIFLGIMSMLMALCIQSILEPRKNN